MNPIKKGISWLYHYLFSNTLHGTHSPFVYAFLENTVYQPNSNNSDKFSELIERISKTRDADKVLIFDFVNALDVYDLYEREKSKADQDSIFIFKNIRNSDQSFITWGKISKDIRNNISIDFFEIGVLFFDQKKPKEHFRIYY